MSNGNSVLSPLRTGYSDSNAGLQIKSRHVKSSLGQHARGVAHAASDFIDMLPRVVGFRPFGELTGRAEENAVISCRVLIWEGSNEVAP